MTINVLLALMVIISFLLSIPLHEFGHALMASWLGDSTPRAEGRLSLSIPAHIDPLGTLMCVILAFQLVPIGRSEEHTSELQSQSNLVCRLLLEKKKKHSRNMRHPTTIRTSTAAHVWPKSDRLVLFNVYNTSTPRSHA